MNKETFINDIPLSVAVAAYAGISFTPDKRGEQVRASYAEMMVADYDQLCSIVQDKPELRDTMEAEFQRYRVGYISRYLDKLRSDSRCMSTMITGPANFPVARNEKRNRVAHRRLEELIEFRKRALAAITKTLCPELRPIMAGDSNAVQALEAKIAAAEKLQDQMKAVNVTHKRFLKDPASLDASDLPENLKQRIRDYKPEYSWEPHPIPPFELTNNGANIRRMKERLEVLKRDKATLATEKQGENGIRLLDCPADNRIRLFFPGKPEFEVRAKLKSNGFRWSPMIGAWQAYRNHNALSVAQSMTLSPTV